MENDALVPASDVDRSIRECNDSLSDYLNRVEALARYRIEAQDRLQAQFSSLAGVLREIRGLVAMIVKDHTTVANHEERIRALEQRITRKDEPR